MTVPSGPPRARVSAFRTFFRIVAEALRLTVVNAHVLLVATSLVFAASYVMAVTAEQGELGVLATLAVLFLAVPAGTAALSGALIRDRLAPPRSLPGGVAAGLRRTFGSLGVQVITALASGAVVIPFGIVFAALTYDTTEVGLPLMAGSATLAAVAYAFIEALWLVAIPLMIADGCSATDALPRAVAIFRRAAVPIFILSAVGVAARWASTSVLGELRPDDPLLVALALAPGPLVSTVLAAAAYRVMRGSSPSPNGSIAG